MADKSKKSDPNKRLQEDQRFKYIGFEVFPGKIKDLFKNAAEKTKYEETVLAKRAKGDVIRDDCSLTVERVTAGERILLTVACLLVIAALFFPFYSAYSEIEIINETAAVETPPEPALLTDSITEPLDSAAVVVEDTSVVISEDKALAEEVLASDSQDSTLVAATTDGGEDQGSLAQAGGDGDREEVLTGLVTRKKYHKEFERLSGLGGLISIGTVGSYLFSSGTVLILTAILMLAYTLACLGLPALTLYGLYGSGAKGDALTLKIKKLLKLSWWPIMLFVATLMLSFVGAEYGFDSESSFTSLGRSYGTGVLLDSLSYGIAISLSGFFILASKSSEI